MMSIYIHKSHQNLSFKGLFIKMFSQGSTPLDPACQLCWSGHISWLRGPLTSQGKKFRLRIFFYYHPCSCDAECWSCHNWNCNLIFWPNHAQMKALGTRRIRVRNLWRNERRAGKRREQQHNEAQVMKENERWARECVCKTSIQKTRKWCLKRPKTATNTPPPPLPPRSASWGFMWCFLGIPSN